MFSSISGRSVIVTGGSKGIGAGLARVFASKGAQVLVVARDASRAEATAAAISGPITGYPGWAHYGASKAGQLGFMRTAALELSPHAITINAVLPGNIKTEGLDDLCEDYIARMTASIPQHRLGCVEDIANAALFFASDEAAYITGQTLVIDGGQVLPESLMALD
ncbi:SDR family oxidoreductase [Methylocystis echinoides]|uniref:SDR family oxidoreductase n=1 Tax=Methylocystis echinoides TaxID=29468 RepID=UPI003433696D